MLTYTPKPVTAVPRTNEYPWLLLLLVLIWLWPGVFQHDLWKPGELGVMQAVDEMAAIRAGCRRCMASRISACRRFISTRRRFSAGCFRRG